VTQRGLRPARYTHYEGDKAHVVEGGVIDEARVCIFVNGHELATLMCSPIDLTDMALGFLRAEGLIERMADVRALTLADSDACVDVWLNKDIALPARRVITSGCGGGLTFQDYAEQHPPIESTLSVAPQVIHNLMRALNGSAALYQEVRGVHTSGLADKDELLLVAQDIGRHNTIDRLWGMAMQRGVDTTDRILLASGRISSEMLLKAMAMRVPIVCSRTSPTALSVQLAEAWGLTVIGYARGGQFRVYTGGQRITG
jgi:FdhD protein